MNSRDKRAISSPINGIKGGVKSDEGKAISSQNATKHGILSKYSTSFDDISFDVAYELFANEFGDDTPSRKTLITHAAVLFIRLRRSYRFESEFVKHQLNPPIYTDKFEIGELKFEELTHEGDPMTLKPGSLTDLDNLYTKYEPQFVNKFVAIVDLLTRTNK